MTRAWLLTICGFLVAMIAIGGITRLTQSGLSIVEWAPLMGALPPLNESHWQAAFDAYKAFPQFEKVFPQMGLSEFKWIYFWEYIHRLIGRSIGLIVFLPGLFLYWRKALPKKLFLKVLLGMGLGGLQGALGWYMVKSGLIDRPSVSHYRLASHFGLALIILVYFQKLYFEYCPHPYLQKISINSAAKAVSRNLLQNGSSFFRFAKIFVLPLLCLQLVYGAFVAGMKAGWIYNTFPKMHDHWFPPEALNTESASNFQWANFFENGAAVQWVHRWLAFLLVIVITFWGTLMLRGLRKFLESSGDEKRDPQKTSVLKLKKDSVRFVKLPLVFLMIAIALQYVLGATMLVLHTPVTLGVMHQLLGVTLLLLLVWFLSRIGSLSTLLEKDETQANDIR